MSQSNNSDGMSDLRIQNQKTQQRQQQQLACDRCRGQKLRCTRTQNLPSSCERCQKAGTNCVINPAIRMGRPQKDKRRGETANVQRRKRQKISSAASTNTDKPSCLQNVTNNMKNDNIWGGRNTENAYRLRDASANDVRYQDSLNLELDRSTFENDGYLLFPLEDCITITFDFVSSQMPLNLALDMYQFGAEENIQPSSPYTFTQVTALNCGAEEKTITQENFNTTTLDTSVPMKQALIEKISSLNIEIHRQLSVIVTTARDNKMVETDSYEPTEQSKTISAAISFMVQGLQTFQELLLDTVGSSIQNSSKDTTSDTMQCNIEDQPPTMQNAFWQNPPPYSANIISLTDARSNKSSSPCTPHNYPRMTPIQNSSKYQKQNGQSQIILLDIPTSLLVISCYINLIHLCREVFAAIRISLLSPNRQTTFATLLGFQISGISFHQDSDLQIMILTQAVVRLVDRIGHSLSYPHGTIGEASQRDEDTLCSRAIMPHLLDFVLKQEEIGGQRFCDGGFEALRDEIRKLNKVVYKPV